MNYDDEQKVQFSDQEHLGQLMLEIGNRLEAVKELLNPAADSWPLAHGRVGVIFVPSIPPSTACVLEHPDSGHWMLQYPCDGIFIYDLSAERSTLH